MQQVSIIIWNDGHSLRYFIDVIHKVFHYSTVYCYWLAFLATVSGKVVVWTGNKELAELKMVQIAFAGPDCYGDKVVVYPFVCEIVESK